MFHLLFGGRRINPRVPPPPWKTNVSPNWSGFSCAELASVGLRKQTTQNDHRRHVVNLYAGDVLLYIYGDVRLQWRESFPLSEELRRHLWKCHRRLQELREGRAILARLEQKHIDEAKSEKALSSLRNFWKKRCELD